MKSLSAEVSTDDESNSEENEEAVDTEKKILIINEVQKDSSSDSDIINHFDCYVCKNTIMK